MNYKTISLVIILCLLCLTFVDLKKKKKKTQSKDDAEDESDNEERTPRNRNYKGKEKFGPIIGYGPFKLDRGDVADRSYDVGYILGQGYGFKLSEGIKTGIKKSLSPGFFSKRSDDDDEEEE